MTSSPGIYTQRVVNELVHNTRMAIRSCRSLGKLNRNHSGKKQTACIGLPRDALKAYARRTSLLIFRPLLSTLWRCVQIGTQPRYRHQLVNWRCPFCLRVLMSPMRDIDLLESLRAENARLVVLLEATAIDWRPADEPIKMPTSLAEPSAQMPNLRFFDGYFGDGATCTRSAGRAREVRLVTHLSVPTSGESQSSIACWKFME